MCFLPTSHIPSAHTSELNKKSESPTSKERHSIRHSQGVNAIFLPTPTDGSMQGNNKKIKDQTTGCPCPARRRPWVPSLTLQGEKKNQSELTTTCKSCR
jgi:hypothetical protein